MAIKEEDKGLTNVRQYDTYASYNADTERNDATISFVEQDNSIWVQSRQYSQNAGCFVGSNASGVSTTAWYLAGVAEMGTSTADLHIIGSAQKTIQGSTDKGIFALDIRKESSGTINHAMRWFAKMGNNCPKLRLVVDGTKVKLYCQVYGGQYHFVHIQFFDSVGRVSEANSAKFVLSDNTTPETTDPVGTDIADVPYLLKSGGTVTGAVAFKEWVYNSKPINNKQGEYAHIAHNTRGTVGYVKVATITINQNYADEPIYFEIMQRQQPLAKLRLQYATAVNTNPPLNTFTYQGTSVNRYYLHQTGSGVWDLYVGKLDSWSAVTISKMYIGGYSSGYYQSAHFTITWQDELATSIPEGSIAATLETENVNITGNAGSAATATSIRQAVTTGDYNRRVLLGGTNNTEEYSSSYKSANLFYNPSTGELTNQSGVGSTVMHPHQFRFYLPTDGWARAMTYRYSSNVIGHIGAYGNSGTLSYYYMGSGYANPEFKFNPATKTMEANASTATKLQNARKVGFTNFDGTADISLNAMQGKFSLTWSTNTTQWQRIIQFKTNATYQRHIATIAVGDGASMSFQGILRFGVATYGTTSNLSVRLYWLSLSVNVSEDFSKIFKAYVTYPSANDEYVYVDVYANSPKEHVIMVFNTLSVSDIAGLTFGGSGKWLEESEIPGTLVATSAADTSLVPKQALASTDTSFLQSLEGLSHKSNDSSLNLRRRTEYICGQQVLSDTEEAGKAFYGSSTNPLVISVPLKDPANAVAGGKVNVNIIRFYYSDTYWQELFFCVNSPNVYTRWVANGNARPWYRMMKEDSTIEYDAWVTKATTAGTADVANKTKYPIVFKRNGASITNWFADTTFTIDIPEELLGYSAPTGIALKVPEINVANEAKKVSNDLEIKVNGVQQVSFDGSSAKTVNIRANKTHFVKAANFGNGWTSPTAGATTPGIPLVLDTSFMIPLGQLMDGDTIIMQVPNTLTSTLTYPVYLQLDATEGIVTGNIVKIIKAQNAGTPVEWKGTTALTAGYYHFVYSEGAGGLIFMYRNVATS